MRGILLLLTFLTTSFTMAQKFELTPEGLRDKESIDKDYLVLHFNNLTAKELYTRSYNYLQKKYANADEAIKGKIENEYLRTKTFIPNFLKVNNGLIKVPVNAEYNLELHFKDDKIKFQITNESFCNTYCLIYKRTKSHTPISGYFLFNKKGKVKLPYEKKYIEAYFNKEAKELTNAIMVKNQDDDW